MIHQISDIKSKTEPLPKIKKSPSQANPGQAQLKVRKLPDTGLLWSPMTAGPFIVPITRWIE